MGRNVHEKDVLSRSLLYSAKKDLQRTSFSRKEKHLICLGAQRLLKENFKDIGNVLENPSDGEVIAPEKSSFSVADVTANEISGKSSFSTKRKTVSLSGYLLAVVLKACRCFIIMMKKDFTKKQLTAK